MTIKTRDIVMVGLSTALCVIGTMIRIPYGNGAMIHFGTAMLYTIAILFGGFKAAFAGAVGTAFFDLIMGFGPYTLWSFFIKGIAGFLVGVIANSGKSKGKNFNKNFIACLIGSVWTLIGYIVAWTYVIGSLKAALLNTPGSLFTSLTGIAAALILTGILRPILEKTGVIK